jgi:hypothetical protein
VGLPKEALDETEAAQGQIRNRFQFQSSNRKRPRTSLAECGQMAAMTNQRGNATDTCTSLETDGGPNEEEDSKPSPVTSSGSSAVIASNPGHQVVQEEPTAGQIPSGWIRMKLEPDC